MESENKLDLTIKNIESYYFGDSSECGEQLFLGFFEKHKEEFQNHKLDSSTENKFE